MDSELRSLLNIDVRSLYEEPISHEIADRYLTVLQTSIASHMQSCKSKHE